MKVLLINPPIREWSKPNVFPLGLGYIASVLKESGYRVGLYTSPHMVSFTERIQIDTQAIAEAEVAGLGQNQETNRRERHSAGIHLL